MTDRLETLDRAESLVASVGAGQPGRGPGIRTEDSLEREARNYVLRHYTECDRCSTSRMAEMLGVTASHLCHVYKKAFGVPIGHDLRRLRIALAKELLGRPTLSIKEVAAEVGYGKATYRAFFNAFRAEVGMAPSAYRRRRLRELARNGARRNGLDAA